MSLKTEYNALLKRFYAAERWIDSPDRKPGEVKQKYLDEFLNIKDKLGELLKQMEKQGIKYTDKEVINGFDT